MSQIDRSLEPSHRERLLEEVRWFLPGFLSAASIEREATVSSAAGLLGLDQSDLKRVLAVHIMLAAPIRDLIEALPQGTRRPITSSHRQRVASRAVSSGIDWAATARYRSTSSPANPEWIVRPARRMFDVPENRALAWLLAELQTRANVARVSPAKTESWKDEILKSRAAIDRHRALAWMEGIPSIWPGDNVYSQLSADRIGFYRSKVMPAAKYLHRILSAPRPQEIVEALCDRYFEPSQDWRLFEIAVLLRIRDALIDAGYRPDRLRLLDQSKSPFASFRLTDDYSIRVWYQRWPPSSGRSELLEAVEHYGIGNAGYSRPDIVLEITKNGQAQQLKILELKASSSATYLASGFSQLLSYLRERPLLTSYPASGWLVAPQDGGSLIPHQGRALQFASDKNVTTLVLEFANQAIH